MFDYKYQSSKAAMSMRQFIVALIFLLQLNSARSEDIKLPSLSDKEIDQAFAILDGMLPPKEKFDMKNAPPSGEVINADGSHYIFNPKIYVPLFNGADFSHDFIDRLAADHPRIMTRAHVNSLPEDHQYFRMYDGRSYLPDHFDIQWIHQKNTTSAEALVHCEVVGAAADHQILLEYSSDKWSIKRNKVVSNWD